LAADPGQREADVGTAASLLAQRWLELAARCAARTRPRRVPPDLCSPVRGREARRRRATRRGLPVGRGGGVRACRHVNDRVGSGGFPPYPEQLSSHWLDGAEIFGRSAVRGVGDRPERVKLTSPTMTGEGSRPTEPVMRSTGRETPFESRPTKPCRHRLPRQLQRSNAQASSAGAGPRHCRVRVFVTACCRHWLSYSSWRRHQKPSSLRPSGARSSHWYMPQRLSSPRAYAE
jgi:hypothetical protein